MIFVVYRAGIENFNLGSHNFCSLRERTGLCGKDCTGIKMEEESFFKRVYRVVERVPRGKVASYGQIAWMIGSPRAARQVGYAMRRCREDLPWYRIVRADGSIVGGVYEPLCRQMLKAEGISFLADGRVDMKLCCWDGMKTLENKTEEIQKVVI